MGDLTNEAKMDLVKSESVLKMEVFFVGPMLYWSKYGVRAGFGPRCAFGVVTWTTGTSNTAELQIGQTGQAKHKARRPQNCYPGKHVGRGLRPGSSTTTRIPATYQASTTGRLMFKRC